VPSQHFEQSAGKPAHSREEPEKNGQPVVTRVEREVETKNVVTHLSPRVETNRSVSLANVVHPVSVAPVLHLDNRHDAEPTIASEPTIQVTIGRVEVRSVVADEGRRSQQKSQSRLMSLDDYLRERDQGAKS